MRSILFDFGGTLDADGTTWIDRFFRLYREEGLSPTRERFEKAFYDSDDNLSRRFKLEGLDLEQTLSLQTQCVLDTLAPAQPDLKERLVQRFLDDCRKHFHRNRPVLERLRRDYKLGIVSNFYGNLNSVLDGEDLLVLFDTVADSGAVGKEKPDAGIFLHATKSLGLSPADCLMVGDSIRRDMRGAEGLDMPHILVTQDPGTVCCPKAKTVSALSELESCIENF